MDKLRAIKLFVRLADLGSFTKVAEENNASKSMISKEISRLEEDLGVRLLHRSTRNLTLTQLGEGYLQRCREILIKMDDAESYLQDLQGSPRGKLKINAPMALGLLGLDQMFSAFMQAYPDIELDIHLGDESIDLIKNGFDLGFRAASQPFDSSYVGRALTSFSYKVCASSAYLARHPKITKPADLQMHNCFEYSYFRGKNVWPLDDGITISGNLKVNSVMFMQQAIKDGVGIAFLPDFICRDALERGEMVEILPKAKRPRLTLHALYPARHFVPPKLTKCIEFLDEWFNASSNV
ncbi:MAG: LysR family transcriptional regulator [Oceanospirillaceae bacterium]